MPSAARVAGRHLSRLPWTAAHLKRLIRTIEQKVGKGTPGADALQRLLKQHEAGIADPYPINELASYLEWRNAWPEELEVLRNARPPRKKPRLKTTVMEATSTLERVAGKSLIYTNVNLGTDHHLVPAIQTWTRAIKGLSKYRTAWKLWQSEVRKIRIMGHGVGPEASWQASGVLYLNLTKTPRNVGSAREILVHELGHALEDKLDLTVTPWDDTPYGQPPYVSSYADMNASEDFAETFRALATEPSQLKRTAPAKYVDMRSRV